jgi:hypothetical protein
MKNKCKRKDLKDCPYRYKDIDYNHWIIRAGKSLEFAEQRAQIICESIPCNYAIELLLREKNKNA